MPDRAVVGEGKLDPSCGCKGCDGSCEAYEDLITDRWEEPMSSDKKISEYGVPGDGFNVYATPEGHIVLELTNTQVTRIAMTAGFAGMLADELVNAIKKVSASEFGYA